MYDMIVIGAGAAGMTAALYALRNNKTVLVLESESLGGQIATSPRLEYYPSIKDMESAFVKRPAGQREAVYCEYSKKNEKGFPKISHWKPLLLSCITVQSL